jgi:hypothetical protein
MGLNQFSCGLLTAQSRGSQSWLVRGRYRTFAGGPIYHASVKEHSDMNIQV